MSAFVVGHAHIDALLSWSNQYGLKFRRGDQELSAASMDDLTVVGKLLLATNLVAVGAAATASADYIFTFAKRNYALVEIIKACQCYRYQACELSDYNDSFACQVIRHIEHEAIARLPGYDLAQWEITS